MKRSPANSHPKLIHHSGQTKPSPAFEAVKGEDGELIYPSPDLPYSLSLLNQLMLSCIS